MKFFHFKEIWNCMKNMTDRNFVPFLSPMLEDDLDVARDKAQIQARNLDKIQKCIDLVGTLPLKNRSIAIKFTAFIPVELLVSFVTRSLIKSDLKLFRKNLFITTN